MNTLEINLDLMIAEADVDAKALDNLTYQMIHDLQDLGAESVNRLEGDPAPEGSKGDPFTISALALVALPAVLPSIIKFLQAWTLRGENRKVKIKTPTGLEVEFTSEKRLSEEELLALVDKLSQVG